MIYYLKKHKKILSVLYPIIPHFVSECLEDLKIGQNIKWPLVDKKLILNEETNIVIQNKWKKKINH